MVSFTPVFCVTSFAFLALMTSPLVAQDKLKVAIGQMETWVNQAPVLGQETGIFKKHDIELEKRRLPEAGKKQTGRQRREQRRHFSVSNEPTIDEAETNREDGGGGERVCEADPV